jgi:hypothetical protein
VPPARRKLQATGAGETPGHGQGGDSEPSVRGKPRTTRCWADFGASGLGESPVPPGKRETRKEEPRAIGAGKTSKYVAEGKPRVVCGEESSGPSAKGKLQVVRRRGNPELHNEKKALSHPAKRKLEPFGLGETPVNWQKKALSHWLRKYSAPPGLGETPGSLVKRKSASHGAGSPEPPGDLVATGVPGAFLALAGGRAAQRTLRNRRERAARLGEAPVSHTYRGLVPCLPPLCPTGQNRARTDTPPAPAFPGRGGADSALVMQFEGADMAGRPPRAGLGPLVGGGTGRVASRCGSSERSRQGIRRSAFRPPVQTSACVAAGNGTRVCT